MTCTILYVACLISFPAPTFFLRWLSHTESAENGCGRLCKNHGTSFMLPIRLQPQQPASFRQKDRYWWHATCGHAEFVGLYGRTECVPSKFTGIDCSKSDPGMFDDVCEHARLGVLFFSCRMHPTNVKNRSQDESVQQTTHASPPTSM